MQVKPCRGVDRHRSVKLGYLRTVEKLLLPTSTEKLKRVVLKAGDVFEMLVPDGRLGYGTIIIGGKCPYIIVHSGLYSARPSMNELASDSIAFVGWTMDALVYHRRWTLVMKGYPSRHDIPYQNCKVKRGDQIVATDFSGRVILGPITLSEAEILDFKSSWSPIIFQDALEALHGFGEWKPNYDEITPAYAFNRMTRLSS